MTFFPLEFRNKFECRYFDERINIAADTAISCKNVVNFVQVTSEITRSEYVSRRHSISV